MTKKKNYNVKFDSNDWQELYEKYGSPNLKNVDDLVALRKQGVSSHTLSILAMQARENGNAPDDILPTVKHNSVVGGQKSIIEKVRDEVIKLKLQNGNEVEVPSYISPLRESTEGEESQANNDTDPNQHKITDVVSAESLRRAEAYCLTAIVGHITTRFQVIAVNGGNVKKIGGELKTVIDNIVSELT